MNRSSNDNGQKNPNRYDENITFHSISIYGQKIAPFPAHLFLYSYPKKCPTPVVIKESTREKFRTVG